MTTMETLLRPRPGAFHPEPWHWMSSTIATSQSWRERSGNDAEQWRVWARQWLGPPEPRRRVPVVLVHGLAVASVMMAPVGDRLGADGPVFAPDLPGNGRSDKPSPGLDVDDSAAALIEWCHHHVEGKPILAGISIGATIALGAAAQAPEEFTGVVALSPIMDPEYRNPASIAARWPLEGSTQSVRMQLSMVRDYVRSGLRTPLTLVKEEITHPTEDDVRELTLPTLFVVGSRDPLTRAEWVHELGQIAPHAEVAVFPGGVHAMSHDNPIEVSRLINGFIDQLAADQPDLVRSTS